MSYPYPQDRSRDRVDKGDQPYKDAKEAMAQQDADLENEVGAQNAPDLGPATTDEVSDDVLERLRRVNDDIRRKDHDEVSDSPTGQ